VNDPISAYRHWKGINANEANFRRLCRYYEAKAEDRSKITFKLRKTGMKIQIFVHRRAPKKEFQALLHQFYTTKNSGDVVSNENVEIQVADRNPTCDMHPDYKVLDANETHVEHLCRYYEAKAEDQSWIAYKFRPAGMEIYVIVHKRVPLQEFGSLLEEFLRKSSERDVVGDENVEIRVANRGADDRDRLEDGLVDDSEDQGVGAAGIDGN